MIKVIMGVLGVICLGMGSVRAGEFVGFGESGRGSAAVSLKESFTDVAENSGTLVPDVAGQLEVVGAKGFGKEPVMLLRSRQALLKRLVLHRISSGERAAGFLAAMNMEATIILFDSQSVYLASDRLEVFAAFPDAGFKTAALDAAGRDKGMCTTIVKYGKRCAWWANLICTAWELYEIYEEVCGGDDNGSSGGQPTPWTPGPGPGAVPPGNPFEYRHI